MFRTVIAGLDSREVVVVAGVANPISLTRLHARFPEGRPACSSVSRNYRTTTTPSGALTPVSLPIPLGPATLPVRREHAGTPACSLYGAASGSR